MINVIKPIKIKYGYINANTSSKISCIGSYPKRKAKNTMASIILIILFKFILLPLDLSLPIL